MIDFAKLYCDLHPCELITNFCLKQTCQIGLCATCICTHTDNHISNNTSPEYQNIRTTYTSMHQTIRKRMEQFDIQRNRINKLLQFITIKRKTVKQNIEQVRTQTFDALNKFFENKQKHLIKEIEIEQKRMGLHNQTRMESLLNIMSRQSSNLVTSAQQLNSQNFLQSYKRIRTQVLTNTHKIEQQISKQLDKNQNFQTVINSNSSFIQEILNILDKSLTLSFKIPNYMMNQNQSKFENQKNKQIQNKKRQFYLEDQGQQQLKDLSFQQLVVEQKDIKKPYFETISQTVTPKSSTSRSIPIYQNQIQNISQIKRNRSFINRGQAIELMNVPLTPKSQIYQSQIFRQRNPNELLEAPNINQLSKMTKNCQSQMIIGQKKSQKPIIYQNGQSNIRYHQNIQRTQFQPIKENFPINTINNSRQMTQVSKIPVKNKNQVIQFENQNFQKNIFIPQRIETYHAGQTPNLLNTSTTINQFKRGRKSGLSLSKGNLSTLI